MVPKGYSGISIFPFIFLSHKTLKTDTVLMNHEYIHLRQQLELLIIPFYVWYAVEFLIRLAQYKHWHNAYRNISFEREAFANETNLKYLVTRPIWKFLNYLSLNNA